jgi:acyl carrier protein
VGRWLAGGDIEFGGRLDNQVKVRGIRIELEDIEAALSRHESVLECVVSVHHHGLSDQRLVAYVESSNGLSAPELRRFLKLSLPDHMIPGAFVFMDAMPRTTNMKVDRQALPKPDFQRPELDEEFIAPRTPTETLIAHIWQDILHVDRIGVYDNFFELGGHSLLATQVVNKIRQARAVDLPLRRFFESPTVASLAEALDSGQDTQRDDEKIARLLERIKQLPDDEAKTLAHLKKLESARNNS